MTNQPQLAGFGPAPIAKRPENIGKAQISYRDAGSILARGTGFLSSYDFTLNPFTGCTFSCTYCYAQSFIPDDKARDDWGNWAIVKQNAMELIARRRDGSLDGKRIYMSSVTDPYQPIERSVRLTRSILEILAERHRPKLVVQTRSPDATRDIDLFKKIEERGGRVQVNMTVTTDDEDIRRAFEPGCPANHARMKAIGEIAATGVQTAVTLTPLLLVSDPKAFAASLLETGVRRFIIQGFNINERNQFVAHTRELALSVLRDKLRCPDVQVLPLYQERYEWTKKILMEALPKMGEGREGFAPPF